MDEEDGEARRFSTFDARILAANLDEEDPDNVYELLMPTTEADEGPIIRAAGKSGSTELQKLLDMLQRLTLQEREDLGLDFVWSEELYGCWHTALLRAVRNERLENVNVLLRVGVDPNGISTFWQETYTFRFRRVLSDFRQRADFLSAWFPVM
jgi:hypothetical protein